RSFHHSPTSRCSYLLPLSRLPPPPTPPLFPYTTLFRSRRARTLGLPGRSLRPAHRSWPIDPRRQARLPGHPRRRLAAAVGGRPLDRKSTRLNSSHGSISYAVFCLKKKKYTNNNHT